jgi:hypothetical protein
MGNKAKFVEGTPNSKRTSAKKSRGFGMGYINPKGTETDVEDLKTVVDAHCQSRDPLFKVKGKERHRRLKMMIR